MAGRLIGVYQTAALADFKPFPTFQFRRIDAGRHFIDGAATARLYWKSP